MGGGWRTMCPYSPSPLVLCFYNRKTNDFMSILHFPVDRGGGGMCVHKGGVGGKGGVEVYSKTN